MKFRTSEKLEGKQFQRSIKKNTRGRKSKLGIKDMLLMTLEKNCAKTLLFGKEEKAYHKGSSDGG